MNPKDAKDDGAPPRAGASGPTGRTEASDSIAIRPAGPDDVALILQLIRELAAYERLLGEVEVTETALRKTLFPAGGAPPSAHVLIGEMGSAPAGFAVYLFNYSTFLGKPGIYLEDLFVRPGSRGKGLGTALLLHLVALARERACGRMEWAVLNWNQPAIDFYKRLGAVPLEEWTVFRLTGAALQGPAPRRR
jgi:GNAT superfamily N-acetyltransferase